MLDYYVDPNHRLITTRVASRVSLGDLANHLQQILRDPKFCSDFNALIVVLDAAAMPAASSVELMKPLVKAWSSRRAGAKWALVLPDQAARGFAESALAALKLTSVSARCFLSKAAAMAWLEEAATAPPRQDLLHYRESQPRPKTLASIVRPAPVVSAERRSMASTTLPMRSHSS